MKSCPGILIHSYICSNGLLWPCKTSINNKSRLNYHFYGRKRLFMKNVASIIVNSYYIIFRAKMPLKYGIDGNKKNTSIKLS